MYRKNLHSTTGISPVKSNQLNYSNIFSFSAFDRIISQKGNRPSAVAFLLLITALLFVGCESPGSVGEGIGTGEESVETTNLIVDTYSVLKENSYSGRLQYTALGYFEDPVFGTINSVALLKPDISRAQADTLKHGDKMYLRLILSSSFYGNENSTSSFEVFEAGEIWRGTQLRYNNQVSVNYSSKVGEFQVADEDTLEIEMSREWSDRFIDFYNESASNRDSLYVRNFPGLAIVPSENNQKIHFLKHAEEEEGDLVTGFLVESFTESDDDENGNGNGEDNGDENDDNGDAEEEEEGIETIRLRDWGASFIRTDEQEVEENIVLHSTERVLKIETDLPVQDLRNKNIVNAQLILTKDENSLGQSPGIVRPGADLVRINVFNGQPRDLMAEIFTVDPVFFAVLEDNQDTFKIDITDHILDKIHGDTADRNLFLTIQNVDGIIYSSSFIGSDGPDNLKPRIVITSVR